MIHIQWVKATKTVSHNRLQIKFQASTADNKTEKLSISSARRHFCFHFLPSYSSIFRRRNEAFRVTGWRFFPTFADSSSIIASTFASLRWLELRENLFDKCRRRKPELLFATLAVSEILIAGEPGAAEEVEGTGDDREVSPFSGISWIEFFGVFIVTIGGSDMLYGVFLRIFRNQLKFFSRNSTRFFIFQEFLSLFFAQDFFFNFFQRFNAQTARHPLNISCPDRSNFPQFFTAPFYTRYIFICMTF